jgi:hypothetical protein
MITTLLYTVFGGLPGLLVLTLQGPPPLGWMLTMVGVTAGIILAHRGPAVVAARISLTSELGWASLAREMARARRYERPFTLVRIVPNETAPVSLDEILGRCREVDLAWDDDGIWLAAADTDSTSRDRLVERLSREIPALATDGRVRAQTFPSDALTLHQLVAGLTEDVPVAIRLAERAASALDGRVPSTDAVAEPLGRTGA